MSTAIIWLPNGPMGSHGKGSNVKRLAFALLILLLSTHPAAFGEQVPAGAVGFVAAEGADFAGLRRAGGTAVKLLADWSAIEPQAGQFVWKPLDEAVAAATNAGLRVIVILAYTPKWASLAQGPELTDSRIYSRQPARRIGDWEAFVSKAASRYKGKVRDWQVWTALSLPAFRGTAGEYLALLRAARVRTRASDPTSRVVLATPYGIDLALIRRVLLEAPAAFDTVSLAPRGMKPEELLRPLGVLQGRLLAEQSKRIWIDWDLGPAGARSTWPGQIVKVLAISRALGVDQVFWVGEAVAGMAALDLFATQVGTRPFVGYLVAQQALVFLFGETNPTAVTWSGTGEIPVPLRADTATVYSPTGEVHHPRSGGGRSTVWVSTEPTVITGISETMVPEAKTTLLVKGLPVPPAGQDFSRASEVSVRLGTTNVERGLYNTPYRSRRNGAVEVVQVDGTEAVRTNAAKEIVFVYFHVDDTFLYFVDGRAMVEIAVEVRGAKAPQQLGFNLLYDAMSGYRFTPWQWVETNDGWVTYTVRLTDANFSGTWGWDFAINAGGNRYEDLTVRTVTVRKIPKS